MAKSKSSFNKSSISLTPDALITLFEIDFSSLQADFSMLEDVIGANIGADCVYRFCPMKNSFNPIYWQGKGYQPLPIEIEGFEQQGDGRLPRPKMTLGNPDGLLSKIVHSNHDFANCKVTRKRTFARFLDDNNFIDPGTKNDEGRNPFGEADPDAHYPDDVYFINKKSSENKNVLQFELVSALELSGSEIPARIVMPNYCNWVYRCSVGCQYKGLPIETLDGNSLTEGIVISSKAGKLLQPMNPDDYPNGIESIKEWSSYGESGTSSNIKGYPVGAIVKITPRNLSNPYQSAPAVYVCAKAHLLAKDHHPFFDRDTWLKDECDKTLSACKKRFGREGVAEASSDYERYVDENTDLIAHFNGGYPFGHPSRVYDNKYDFGKAHWEQAGAREFQQGTRAIGLHTLDIPDSKDLSRFNMVGKPGFVSPGLRFGGFPGTDKHSPEGV